MFKRILIGGSAGSLEQLQKLLAGVTIKTMPPIVFAMHLGHDTSSEKLRNTVMKMANITCETAQNEQWLQQNTLYIGDGHYHVFLDSEGKRCRLFDDVAYEYSKPSIDLLFESCCGREANTTLAIVLSGANKDGARGLAKLYQAGATCAVADPQYCAHPNMPDAALKSVPEAEVIQLATQSNWLAQRLELTHA